MTMVSAGLAWFGHSSISALAGVMGPDRLEALAFGRRTESGELVLWLGNLRRTAVVAVAVDLVRVLEGLELSSRTVEARLVFCRIRMVLVDLGQLESWSRTSEAEAGLIFYRIRMELVDLEWLESWIHIRMELVDLEWLESWIHIRMELVDLAELVFCHTELGGQGAEGLEPFWRHNLRRTAVVAAAVDLVRVLEGLVLE
jgi:uncharacterized protein YjeT (DUF2065 family)